MEVISIGMHNDPSLGGVDRYFNSLHASWKSHSGFCHHALAFSTGNAEASVDNRHLTLLGSADSNLFARWAAIRRASNDLIRRAHSQAVYSTHFALYGFPVWHHLKTCPHVLHFHGPWFLESHREGSHPLSVKARKVIEKLVYRTADAAIVLSECFRDILSEHFGILRDRIFVVPGGIESSKYHLGISRLEARQKLNWHGEGLLILCVRRLAHRMGLENLLQAFAQLPPSLRSARLFIGGKGPLSRELELQIQRLGLAERVRLLGFIPEDDLKYAFRAADFTIMPSEQLEGFGLSAIESLACGTPVLVTPVGGLPSTVKGLDRKLILKGTEVNDLREGLESVLLHRIQLPGVEECQAHVRRHFDWSIVAPQILKIYQMCAERYFPAGRHATCCVETA